MPVYLEDREGSDTPPVVLKDYQDNFITPSNPLPATVYPPPVWRTVTPIVDTSIFASGDLAVATLTPLYGVASAPGKTTVLQHLMVSDASVQSATIELWFFDTNAITLPALNAAWAISDAHALRCAGIAQTGTYYASTNNSVSIAKSIGLSMKTAPNMADLWFATIVRGTPTYGAATDLQFTFTFYPDA